MRVPVCVWLLFFWFLFVARHEERERERENAIVPLFPRE